MAFALVTLASCGRSPASPAPSTTVPTATTASTTVLEPTTTPSPATPTTAPCTLGKGYAIGTTTHHLTVDGVDRVMLVHIPPRPVAGMRLVVSFHGATSNMAEQDVYTGFDALADIEGFVVATPNGVDAAVRQWHFLGPDDDLHFAVALIAELAARACVDAGAAYAVGISSGGAMAAALACRASDHYAGFGLVAADFYLPTLCDGATPHPMAIFHGTADPVVPYQGGQVGGAQGLPVAPAETSAAQWAKHNGCSPGPHKTMVASQVVRFDWTGCRAPVVFYEIVGGGHTWPGAVVDVDRLGLTTHQISATQAMWDVFSRSG
jgi:polyhydroxybutyrate depolymerase